MRQRIVWIGLSLALAACSSNGGGGGGGGTDGGTDGGTQSPFDVVQAAVNTSIPNLQGPVEVMRDESGTVHIFCTVDADCFRASGYVQAYDRLFEMDYYRHVAEGRLGAFFGNLPGIRGTDRYLRRFMSTLDGREVYDVMAENLSPEAQTMADAFTEGVNAYLDDLAAGKAWTEPSPEYESGVVYGGRVATGQYTPEPWRVVDSLAIGRLFSYQLSGGGFSEELNLAKWAAALDPADFADLQDSRPVDPTVVLPNFYGGQPLAAPMRLTPAIHARLKKLAPAVRDALASVADAEARAQTFGPEAGSNNWVVAPKNTSTGRPLVSNDPHLSLETPPVWWTVHYDSVSMPGATGALQAKGNAFPGVPVILIGHTSDIAWGDTVVGYDVIDAYAETVTGVDTVSFKGSDVTVQKVTVKMPKGTGQNDFDEEKICIVPNHGPILSAPGMSDDDLADPSKPCVDPSVGTTAFSAKWTGQEPTYEFDAFQGLLYAKNVDDAQAALTHFKVGAQNFVVGDTSGNILYDPHANVPIRDNYVDNPPFFPLPGDGSAEWTGMIPDADLPQVKNPDRGWVVTANNDVVGFTLDGNPLNDEYYFYFTNADGLRAGRITTLLQDGLAGGKVGPDDMKSIQTDTYWQLAALMAPYITQAAQNEPDLVSSLGIQDLVDSIDGWTFATPTGLTGADPTSPAVTDTSVRAESQATTIFASWLFHALDRTFADEEKAAGLISGDHVSTGQQSYKALYFALPNADAHWWDDVSTPDVTETRDQVLLHALADAKDELSSAIDADPTKWMWGRVHINDFPSALGQVGYDPYANPSVANNGAISTVDVANFGRSYHVGAGASMRIVSDVNPDGVEAWMILPGGEVDQTDSANRGDQLPLWLDDQYLVFPFTLDAAISAAQSRAAAELKPGARWSFSP